MIERYESIIIQIVCIAIVPFIQVFSLYVIVHGHYGPGGGFQGGTGLAVSIMLLRICLGREISYRKFPPQLAIVLGSTGMLIFMLAGLLPLITGGTFLDYGHLPVPGVSGAALRSLGILIVEVGIGLAVFGSLVLIYDNLVGGKQ